MSMYSNPFFPQVFHERGVRGNIVPYLLCTGSHERRELRLHLKFILQVIGDWVS